MVKRLDLNQKPTISEELKRQLDDRQLLSVNEGAALVSVSPAMIRRFLEKKILTRYKLNSRTLVSARELLGLVRIG
jgi:hypothetical protein